jgi:coenzyme F420-reducing hydrogenase gamma subunit
MAPHEAPPGRQANANANANTKNKAKPKPTLAVWKFASCDGCQLTLLNCEDELLAITDSVHIASFTEASSEVDPGPYDVSLVEGSITTSEDAERIRRVRAASGFLVTIGACATAGGIQALRNFGDDLAPVVYARPDYISSLRTSTPIADHVHVDFELRGCPIDRKQLIEVIAALLAGRRPNVRGHSVCVECKRAGHVCVLVAHGTPCLGPVTQAGCGALCPGVNRGCYGCFGPMESPKTAALSTVWRQAGADRPTLALAFRGFNAAAEPFRAAAEQAESEPDSEPDSDTESEAGSDDAR